METVKFIIRFVTVIIAISMYFAGWVLYVCMCSKNKEYGNAADIFYAIWTVLHLVAVIIIFVWAWMQERRTYENGTGKSHNTRRFGDIAEKC